MVVDGHVCLTDSAFIIILLLVFPYDLANQVSPGSGTALRSFRSSQPIVSIIVKIQDVYEADGSVVIQQGTMRLRPIMSRLRPCPASSMRQARSFDRSAGRCDDGADGFQRQHRAGVITHGQLCPAVQYTVSGVCSSGSPSITIV